MNMKKIITLIFIGLSIILPLNSYANIAKGFSGSCKWVIDDEGVLTISPSKREICKLENWGGGVTPWFDYCSKITHVKFEKGVYARTCFGMFRNCSLLETVDFNNLNIDETNDMKCMFSGCSSLKEIDMSSLNTDNVVYMDEMFAYCTSLKSIDLSTFDTYKVITMNRMFYNCTSLEYADVSRFWTYNLAEAKEMFFNCKSLKTVNMHFWDFRGLVNMASMFENCESLEYIDMQLFSFDGGSMEKAFKNCHSLKSLNLTGVYDFMSDCWGELFSGCENLRKFYAYNEDPYLWTIHEEMFQSIEDPGKIILYVPRAYLDLYKNAPGWRIFDVRAMEDEPKETTGEGDNKSSENPDEKSSDNTDGNTSEGTGGNTSESIGGNTSESTGGNTSESADDNTSGSTGNQTSETPVTGMGRIVATSKSSVVYSIGGNRISAPRKGINIINGKKYLVK